MLSSYDALKLRLTFLVGMKASDLRVRIREGGARFTVQQEFLLFDIALSTKTPVLRKALKSKLQSRFEMFYVEEKQFLC